MTSRTAQEDSMTIPEDVMEGAREVAELISDHQPVYYEWDEEVIETCLVRNAAIVAKAILAAEQRGEARERERCAKAICSGCASGVPFNDAGLHQLFTFTFLCHAEFIRKGTD